VAANPAGTGPTEVPAVAPAEVPGGADEPDTERTGVPADPGAVGS
jgi:hypothetical protein